MCRPSWPLSGTALAVFIAFYAKYLWSNRTGQFNSESSVWCVNDARHNKMCQFRDVCYNTTTQSFYFFLGNSSVINGLQSYMDLQKLKLSTVFGHNAFFANVTILDLKLGALKQDDYVIMPKTIAMVRFKPDNLMHIIHDDVIPLFTTLELICKNDWLNCYNSFSLLFLDNSNENQYSFIYSIFSENLIHASQLSHKLICFEELHLGLSTETVWYQYGFNQKRGSLDLKYFNFDIVARFQDFIRNKYKQDTKDNNYVLFLKRNKYRKILNAEKITGVIKKKDLNVLEFNVTKENAEKALELAVNADTLVGVHGAEMILALFMKPRSKIIELFPYGISPNVVSFLKPLVSFLPNSYYSWMNNNKNNTVKHPEYPRQLGGISHLSLQQRSFISHITNIDEVYCCEDPAFLHLMFQDTIVGPDFEKAIDLAISSTVHLYDIKDVWMYPGRVIFPSCIVTNKGTSIAWLPPENVSPEKIKYSITVKSKNMSKAFITQDTKLFIRGLSTATSVWVAAVLNGNNYTSADSFLKCASQKM